MGDFYPFNKSIKVATLPDVQLFSTARADEILSEKIQNAFRQIVVRGKNTQIGFRGVFDLRQHGHIRGGIQAHCGGAASLLGTRSLPLRRDAIRYFFKIPASLL
jgi:hypothetical protein